MFPFREHTILETGLTKRIPWSSDRANQKLRSINERHKRDLNGADCRRAAELGVNPVLYASGVLATSYADDGGRIAIDPISSKIKHSGAMLRDRVTLEWREFCSSPQDEEGCEYGVADYVPKEPRKLQASAHLAEASKAVDAEKTIEKRRRGRPRKMESL